jgi:cobalt-zinc-cadmium efflux system outer membrane protein
MLELLLVGVALQGSRDSLTLDAALALARANRGQIAAAAAQVAAARADFRVAGALPNPVASYQYTGDPPRQHVTVDQPLDWLLRRPGERAAARAGIGAALADSTLLTAQVEREARNAFYAAVGAARRLALVEEEAALADSLAAIASRRHAAGEISEWERAQARLEAARARQLVSSGREERALAVAELGRALGTAAETLPPLAGALDSDVSLSLPPAPPTDDLPFVARARADSAAAGAQHRAAQWSRVPVPDFQAGVEWSDPSASVQRATILIGLSLPLPLWQSRGAAAAAAGARADQAFARLREVRAEAASVLAQTAVRIREAALRAVVARDSILPLAGRQRELALAAYRAGETGIVPVLDALRAERQVARDMVADLIAYQQALADWLALVAGTVLKGRDEQ